ncbi:hypothetical protein AN958_09924 [Leucoagaricus sp. SymC.cos]|nr:hypothetical protein AN958_09924 [Leucoagaricus sp. SymC.cos]
MQTHADLHHTLNQAIDTLPPQRHILSTAQSDHLSAMIETSLVKISLLRACAHRSLYGACSQTSQSKPGHEGTVSSAIAIAYSKLKDSEARVREEERALDQKLREYQGLLAVVDGSQGGFQQIVNDWTRVQRETDECRRDLRRLGWTGD